MNENICANCKHWQGDVALYDTSAVCKEIKRKLDFDVRAGWEGGWVVAVETEKDFGCNLFEKRVG